VSSDHVLQMPNDGTAVEQVVAKTLIRHPAAMDESRGDRGLRTRQHCAMSCVHRPVWPYFLPMSCRGRSAARAST
jgi:hypothetical protein